MWKPATIVSGVLLLVLTSMVWAQSLSPQQLSYLRSQFIRATEGTIQGTSIATGSLPADRIQGSVPASKIQEEDPVALHIAQQNAVDIAALESSGTGLSADVSTLQANVTSIQSSVGALQTDVSAIETTLATGISVTIVLPLVGQTNTLTFTDGLLTAHVQEGP